MSAAREALDITHGGTQGGAGEQADAWDLTKLLSDRIGSGEVSDLAFKLIDLLLEPIHLKEHRSQHRS